LQDEIGSIVKQVLTSISPESEEEDIATEREEDSDIKSDNDIDSDSENEETYMQDLTKLLTPVIEDLHESLFALISAHTIARSDSMQNRIEPFDWHDLINILGSPAAAHLVDERYVVTHISSFKRTRSDHFVIASILQNVITRMQALCETIPTPNPTSIPPPPPPSTGMFRSHLVGNVPPSLMSYILPQLLTASTSLKPVAHISILDFPTTHLHCSNKISPRLITNTSPSTK